MKWLKYLTVWILSLLLFWVLFSATAAATLLYTADTGGAVLVQSRRTIKDQDRRSWQVIAFKPIQANQEGTVALRLVGFPEAVSLDHHQPITFTNWQYQRYSAANISDRISRTGPVPLHVGQYDLQTVLSNLPSEPLQLHLATVDQTEILMSIPPALVQEWQRIANTHVADVQRTCDRFPKEARQNPDFPGRVNCSMPGSVVE